ncbi:hypothetical protein ACFL0V_00365 [Nanoarchaeota archaeon]
MGHQAGKIKDLKERDQFLEWLEELEHGTFGIPKPDANILLFMPPHIGQKLVDKKGHRDYVGGTKRDGHESNVQHLIDAADAYAYVSDKFNWIKINCHQGDEPLPIPTIHEKLWSQVKNLL